MKSQLLLDSGAFSAFQTGNPVDVYEYIEYIKKSGVELYMNLDVIGSSEKSWENQEIMEDAGLNPLPIFHADAPIKFLHRCLEYDYFALGGMASGSHESARKAFLDSCFATICDTPDRMPKSRVHGLGLASPLLIARYPFYSADTASGIHYGRYGIIIIPARDARGKLDFLIPPHSLYITERSTAKQHEGHHFCNKSKHEQGWILSYVKERGFEWGKVRVYEVKDPLKHRLAEGERYLTKTHHLVEKVIEDGISSNGVLRDYFNIDFFMQMESTIPEWPWPFSPKQRSMFT